MVLRISERTLSLPPGRALFTYGCLSTATPEAYIIPRIQLSVRIMPANAVMALDQAKLTYETRNWADFHNGVASGLRLSPHSTSIESSWIQFSRPSELSAEHAGFLLGLGLNGHLKHVDTWNTFSYLSPKHDQTSMALLLGLAASNVGSSSHYITRLIAVHTPALLPVRTVDINVSLLTQSAGLTALGLLFLGTGDRRLADVALQEISRADIMAPVHMNREAYTLSAALAFGMIMVGRGSKPNSTEDTLWLNQFRLLIHGERNISARVDLPKNFDLNITAPGACLALAMLYLRSNRTDVADIVSVPTTRIALNAVPPNLLLLRTLAKSLILWDDIQPTADWVNAQYLPMKAFGTARGPAADAPSINALDIANYNVIAGACMALALKYAGSASADAWKVVVFYYDSLIRGVYANGTCFVATAMINNNSLQPEHMSTRSDVKPPGMQSTCYLVPCPSLWQVLEILTVCNAYAMHMANIQHRINLACTWLITWRWVYSSWVEAVTLSALQMLQYVHYWHPSILDSRCLDTTIASTCKPFDIYGF